jgi:hypothetical protein
MALNGDEEEGSECPGERNSGTNSKFKFYI